MHEFPVHPPLLSYCKLSCVGRDLGSRVYRLQALGLLVSSLVFGVQALGVPCKFVCFFVTPGFLVKVYNPEKGCLASPSSTCPRRTPCKR